MKCKYCLMEWNGPSNYLESIRVCPFCQKPLISATEGSTFQEVLRKIVQTVGGNVLSDGKLLMAVFSDFAPTLVREKRLLRDFIECNGNVIIYNEIIGAGDATLAVKRTVKLLTADYSLTEEAANEVCQAFLYAAHGLPDDKKNYKFSDETATVPPTQEQKPFQSAPLPDKVPGDSASGKGNLPLVKRTNEADNNSWVCSCGFRNPYNRKFCENCDMPSRKALVPTGALRENRKSNFWFCSCGYRNSVSRRFCENCDSPRR